ncbi:MAG: flagellar biosynthetic protein FliR [Burkholderiales bacterium]|nr:flagellar biosynthetic protein FliR [Burkholderiales bacterium]
MLTFTEAQLMAWLSPMVWPFVRVLGLFTAAPVLSMRAVPRRVRLGLAAFIAYAAQASLQGVDMPALNSPLALGVLVHEVFLGLTMGFAARVVFAALEFAGELVGLQMGMNFAAFFDPLSGGQATAVSRFYGTMAAWLFIVLDGHLMLIGAVAHSFQAFPVSERPLAFLSVVQPQVWGAEIFRLGLWIALPVLAMLMLVNIVMGLMSRVASQLNIFSVGFPITMGVGMIGLWLTLPLMQVPFTAALERMLGYFQ